MLSAMITGKPISFSGLAKVIKAAFWRGTLRNSACELYEADDDVTAEWEVPIPIADGITLRAHIFKPKSLVEKGEKVPVIMCAHPYNNNICLPLNGKKNCAGMESGVESQWSAPQQYHLIPQAGKPRFSKLTSWEAPDPAFWVKNGYAVVNLNLPGFGGSEGDSSCFHPSQSKAYYEAIEWAGEQDWCTGSVGLNGVSFLAITQYHVSVCRHYGGPPKALKCISPWEALSCMRRDLMGTNGIDDLGFGAFWWNTEVLPAITGLDMKKKDELFRKTMRARPADWTSHEDADEIFANINVGLGPKDFEKMSTPMLLCLSFSDHGMHTQGSSRCWRNSTNLKERWLYTHRTGKWDSYYSDEVHEMTLKFMDHYLKGKDNGWEKTPPVRLEVRSAKDVIHEVRYEQAFPLPDTQYIKLFPTTAGMLKEGSSGGDTGEKTYSGSGGSLRFTYTFAEPTETTGYFKTVLEAEARDGSPDMCVFVNVFKLDKKGENVPFYGSVGSRIDGVTRGIMRASFRALDLVQETAL
ncbi:unnamed protein product [Polarella glacialis]|uniref:Xaa-Pro dipeptidyl-peptidase C-terminal domain-containing protein n=1 Tax=Polarella glacialis TaxID=89957 RepID=A0A813GKD6_POLGL|nr:unnamed protein product [Polarella glacialis]